MGIRPPQRTYHSPTTRHSLTWADPLQLLGYYVHRFVLHAPARSRYSLPHLHRTYNHSIRFPFAFCSSYDHPLCYLLHRWLPLYLPAYLFRYHILTFELLVALSSLEDALAYSGYGSAFLPGTIVANRMARRVDAHQVSGGKGNFGGLGVMDWMHGSSVQGVPDISEDVMDEAEKHDLAGKLDRGSDNAGNALQDFGGKLRGKGRKGSKPKSG